MKLALILEILKDLVLAGILFISIIACRKMQHARAVLRDEVSRMMSERRKIIHEKPDAEFNDFLQHMLLAKVRRCDHSLHVTQV